eukprot:182147-Rhodomonas_salina.3
MREDWEDWDWEEGTGAERCGRRREEGGWQEGGMELWEVRERGRRLDPSRSDALSRSRSLALSLSHSLARSLPQTSIHYPRAQRSRRLTWSLSSAWKVSSTRACSDASKNALSSICKASFLSRSAPFVKHKAREA